MFFTFEKQVLRIINFHFQGVHMANECTKTGNTIPNILFRMIKTYSIQSLIYSRHVT